MKRNKISQQCHVFKHQSNQKSQIILLTKILEVSELASKPKVKFIVPMDKWNSELISNCHEGKSHRNGCQLANGTLVGSLCQHYSLNQHPHWTIISPIEVFCTRHGWHIFYKNTGKLFCCAYPVSILWKHNMK